MSYLVLARKWRPRSFDTLVGQAHVVRALSQALDSGRLHHAWLFTGTRGVGKTTLSRILAKALNCREGISARPCNVCEACTGIDADRYVDYIELDAASNRGVEEMTRLLDQAVYAPSAGRFKVYMIDEVHMLTGHAFNAMLKTLEEPPPHVKFILATTDPQKIPVTVLSRCLQFNLKQMAPDAIAGHLAHVLDAEAVPSEPAALRLLGQAAQGSMRDALSLTDQAIAFCGGTVAEAAVRDMLGVIDQRYLVRLLDALLAQHAAGLLEVADELAERSLSYPGALADLASLLSDIAVAQRVPGMPLEAHAQREAVLRLASALPADVVQLWYSVALHSRAELALAPDEHAGFLMACLRMLALVADAGGVPPEGPSGSRPAALPVPDAAPPTMAAAAPPVAAPARPVAESRPPASTPAPSSAPAMAQAGPAAARAALAAMRQGRRDAPASPTPASAASVADVAAPPRAAPAVSAPAASTSPDPSSAPSETPAAAAPSVAAATDLSAVPSPSEPVLVAPVHEGQAAPQRIESPVPPVAAVAPPPWADDVASPASAPAATPARLRPVAPEPVSADDEPGREDDTGLPGDHTEEPAWMSAWANGDDEGAASVPVEAPFDDAPFETPEAPPLRPDTPPRQATAAPAPRRAASGSARARASAAVATGAAPQPVDPQLRLQTLVERWPDVAATLPVGGTAGELARHSECLGIDGRTVQLRIAASVYAEGAGVERLRDALSQYIGTQIQLQIDVGSTGDQTVQAKVEAARAERQAQAEADIDANPFVQALLNEFGGVLVAGSIRPVDPPSPASETRTSS